MATATPTSAADLMSFSLSPTKSTSSLLALSRLIAIRSCCERSRESSRVKRMGRSPVSPNFLRIPSLALLPCMVTRERLAPLDSFERVSSTPSIREESAIASISRLSISAKTLSLASGLSVRNFCSDPKRGEKVSSALNSALNSSLRDCQSTGILTSVPSRSKMKAPYLAALRALSPSSRPPSRAGLPNRCF